MEYPVEINVEGNMFFGIILSVLKGKTILGKFNFTSNPSSEALKNTSLGFAKSCEEPTLALPENSKVSAPLNTFRIEIEGLNPIPRF